MQGSMQNINEWDKTEREWGSWTNNRAAPLAEINLTECREIPVSAGEIIAKELGSLN